MRNYSIQYTMRVKKEQPTYMKYVEIGVGIGIAIAFVYCITQQSAYMKDKMREVPSIEQVVK